MEQVAEVRVEQKAGYWMTSMCSELFKEWLVELTLEEKEIWLWNAAVAMYKIRQRRPLVG